MSTKKIVNVISYFLVLFLIVSCGAQDQKKSSASGHVEIGDDVHINGPIFLIITKTDDFTMLEKDPAGNLVTLINVNSNGNFQVDFTEFGIIPGDYIYLIGFVDNDYNGSIPMPTFGDYVGFYIDLETMNTAYQVKGGNNEIKIRINRRVYDFKSELRGSLLHDDPGEWKLIAYSGEVDMNMSSIDIDHVIGYKKLNKSDGPCDYSLRIMPYIRYVPILHVYVFAFLDKNKNGKVDGNDIIGYHKDDNGLPKPLKINEGIFEDIDINSFKKISDPSGYDMSVKGNFTAPQGYTSNSDPIFIMIAKADKIDDIIANPMESIKTYQKIVPGGNDFDIDLAKTDLLPGDKIMVIGLWDKDYYGGFPEVTPGDFLGYYMNRETMDYTVELVQGVNYVVSSGEWSFNIDKEIFDYTSSVEGMIADEESGEFTLIAYAGDITSLSMSDINTDDIIAYKSFTKAEGHQPYKLDIMPYGKELPIEDVYIFGFLDRNSNGKLDDGDKYGYYGLDGLPGTVIIDNGILSGVDIGNFQEFTEKPINNMSMVGSFNKPDGYDSSSPPIFIVVAKTSDPQEIVNNPNEVIRTFKKLNSGDVDFNINLSRVDLLPGDEVMVIALWDKDYDGGFPEVTTGDVVGYYVNTSNFDYTVELVDGVNKVMPNGEWEFNVNKEIFDFSASVEGSVTGEDTGNVILVAYAGDLSSMNMSTFDIDDIIGFKKIEKNGFSCDYSLPILPFGKNIPIEDVYIIAILDLNGNGIPDVGDKVGYYKDDEGYPITVTIYDEVMSGIDIELSMDILPESSISIKGYFTKPEGYNASSPPVFVMVAVTDNMQDLVDKPMEVVKSYQKVNPGENIFNITFKEGDINPGDNVYVIGLWDKDYVSGIPGITIGDNIGFYYNTKNFQLSFPVVDGINLVVPEGDWTFDIDKPYTGASATVKGTILDKKAGDLIVLGLVGDISSMDMSAINMNNIIAYSKFSKPNNYFDYSIKVFPFGYNVPIANVQMVAFLDLNSNGIPDEGDYMGFHRNDSNDHMPKSISILDGENIDVDIWLTKKIYNYNTSINFKFNPNNRPEDLEAGDNLIHVVIHTSGVTNNYSKVNFDYVLGIKNIPYVDEPDYIYSFKLLNYIDTRITGLYSGKSISTYVISIFDRNGNGKPDPGEDLACYPDGYIWFGKMVYYPKKFHLKLDTPNWLGDPDWVGFIGKTL